jgi:hypothetical protein
MDLKLKGGLLRGNVFWAVGMGFGNQGWVVDNFYTMVLPWG